MAGLVRFLRHRAQTLRSSGRGTPSMAGLGAGGGGGIGGGLVPPSLLSADRYHHSSNCMADRAVETAAAAWCPLHGKFEGARLEHNARSEPADGAHSSRTEPSLWKDMARNLMQY